MEVIEIKNRWNGKVLYSGEHVNVKEAVEAAVKAGADLGCAYLRGADLAGAYLGCADLRGANLRDANLAGANLRDAYLRDAYLHDAYLGGANLGGANLAGADLRGANLHDADLRCTNLHDADLGGADLHDADLGGADLRDADLGCANLRDANLAGAKVGVGSDGARLVGSRPIVQIGPIGSRNDWLLVFWCGDSGMRISTGCQQQITEEYFLEQLEEAHGEGEQANIHAKHYIEALTFAKRLLKEQL